MKKYNKNDPETIQAMFASIASTYDRANAVLSFQLHKRWNHSLIRHTIGGSDPSSILDLCCGTGEISLTYLRKAKQPCHGYLLDFCPEMLACARVKGTQ